MGNLIFTSQTAPSASESSANDNESPEHLVERLILDTAHESLITVDSANNNSNYGLNKQKSKKKKKNKRKVDASAKNVSGQGSENTRDNTEVNVPFDHHSASSCPATRVTAKTEDQSEKDDEHRSGRPSFEHESPQECTSHTKKKRKKRKKNKKLQTLILSGPPAMKITLSGINQTPPPVSPRFLQEGIMELLLLRSNHPKGGLMRMSSKKITEISSREELL